MTISTFTLDQQCSTLDVFPSMHIKSPLSAERSNARSKRTDQLGHSSVNHQKVVDHLLVSGAIDSADRTGRLAIVDLEVVEQMRSVNIVDGVESLEADAARFGIEIGRVQAFDLHVAGT